MQIDRIEMTDYRLLWLYFAIYFLLLSRLIFFCVFCERMVKKRILNYSKKQMQSTQYFMKEKIVGTSNSLNYYICWTENNILKKDYLKRECVNHKVHNSVKCQKRFLRFHVNTIHRKCRCNRGKATIQTEWLSKVSQKTLSEEKFDGFGWSNA